MERIFGKLLYLMEKRNDTVLVCIIGQEGSSPRGAGSMMLVDRNGRILGTVGGGAVEVRSEQLAMELLKEGRSDTRWFPLHGGGPGDIGMVCGGAVEVLFQFIPGGSEHWRLLAEEVVDRIRKRIPGWLALRTDGGEAALLDTIPGERDGHWFHVPLPIGQRAILFGAGHCAQALAPLLNTVGFRVTVFDDRENLANREHFPTAEQIMVGEFEAFEEKIQIQPEDFVVIMTSGHSYDYQVERQVLRGEFAYLGVIGSRKKTAAINAKLRADGIPEEMIARVHTPIGTAIKAVTPEEIAVSIAGEMILERALRREG